MLKNMSSYQPALDGGLIRSPLVTVGCVKFNMYSVGFLSFYEKKEMRFTHKFCTIALGQPKSGTSTRHGDEIGSRQRSISVVKIAKDYI